MNVAETETLARVQARIEGMAEHCEYLAEQTDKSALAEMNAGRADGLRIALAYITEAEQLASAAEQ